MGPDERPFLGTGIEWYVDINRPVVHECCADGGKVAHIQPAGGKSKIMAVVCFTVLAENMRAAWGQ